MSCDTTSPRLTIVKQTYGRINKAKKVSNVDRKCRGTRVSGATPAASTPAASTPDPPAIPTTQLDIKQEPIQPPQILSYPYLDKKFVAPTPTISSVTLPSGGPPSPQIQTSLLQFTSPRPQPPKSLTLTPPRSVPNILRRTPVKQGGSRKPTTPKSKSVNLSPILYSPKIKKKNPFFNDAPEGSDLSEQAHIITSYVKVAPHNKITPQNNKTTGTQCNINVPRVMQGASSSKSPQKPGSSGERVICDVELQSEKVMMVSHTVNGCVYSGILVADTHRHSAASQCGYISEQFPSQYHKKLKAKLGLSFESGCESENSDNECTKTKLQKLKYSDYKSMKSSIVGASADPVTEATFSYHSESLPAVTPTSRQNTAFQSTSHHNKKSIDGVANFLQEAASAPVDTAATKTKEVTPKESAEKNSKQLQTKGFKPSQPRSNPNSPKKQKLEKAKIVTENWLDGLEPNKIKKPKLKFGEIEPNKIKKPKLKFGEKFITQNKPPKEVNVCHNTQSEDPATVQRKLEEVSQHFRMRSHSIDDQKVLSSVLAENSAKLPFVDLEWPMWCPREFKLEITPIKRGKPARFKLHNNGSKRRRTESNETEFKDTSEEMFTETNNPFGIGDVVIAKYTPGQGRPYWPGKILSVTGLTVCVLFYNTSEVMQIAKCNVEWFYDGCKEHKISLNPANSSTEWKEAVEEAESDVKSCIGRESVVWGLYEQDWWPARVHDIHQQTYTVEWLDDNIPFRYTVEWLDDSIPFRYRVEWLDDNIPFRYTVEWLDDNIPFRYTVEWLDDNIPFGYRVEWLDDNIPFRYTVEWLDDNIPFRYTVEWLDDNIPFRYRVEWLDDNIPFRYTVEWLDDNIPFRYTVEWLDDNIPFRYTVERLDDNIPFRYTVEWLDDNIPFRYTVEWLDDNIPFRYTVEWLDDNIPFRYTVEWLDDNIPFRYTVEWLDDNIPFRYTVEWLDDNIPFRYTVEWLDDNIPFRYTVEWLDDNIPFRYTVEWLDDNIPFRYTVEWLDDNIPFRYTVEWLDDSIPFRYTVEWLDDNIPFRYTVEWLDDNIPFRYTVEWLDDNIPFRYTVEWLDDNIPFRYTVEWLDDNIPFRYTVEWLDDNIPFRYTVEWLDDNIPFRYTVEWLDDNIPFRYTVEWLDDNIPFRYRVEWLDDNIPFRYTVEWLDDNIPFRYTVEWLDDNIPFRYRVEWLDDSIPFRYTVEWLDDNIPFRYTVEWLDDNIPFRYTVEWLDDNIPFRYTVEWLDDNIPFRYTVEWLDDNIPFRYTVEWLDDNIPFRYTVEWLDDNSMELLPLSSLSPFLLSYSVRYSKQCAQDFKSYQRVVDRAHSLALRMLLDTHTQLTQPALPTHHT
ncbi:uncharacterized protein LOC134826221 [Bolinopsis microptera]|uniref:uncharacterized protein LOC134826221 n=1 Tax=Bolinopsis microptera TaxID=2820187 RepID=UPI0030794556